MYRLLFAILAVGGLVMAATVWFTYPRAKPTEIVDPSKYKFMHCSACKRESLYSATAVDMPCPRCDKKMVPTVESIKDRPGTNRFGRMAVYLVTEGIVILGAVVYLLYNPPTPAQEDQYYVYCPNGSCGRKMKFPESRAGAKAACPLCKTTFINPQSSEAELAGSD